jgi:hypothetical protein
MRTALTSVVATLLIALAGLPSAAGAATPRGPSTRDIQDVEAGMPAAAAACMAAFYEGRLSRAEWLAHYDSLPPAQKRVRTAGRNGCTTLAQRVALSERSFARVLGPHAELRCVARALETRGWAVRLSVTTRALELQLYDRVFMGCGMMGVVYAGFAREMQLELSPAEQQCANRVGSVVPAYGESRDSAFGPAVAGVFDRCVRAPSKTAMWRRMMSTETPSIVSARVRACAAERLAGSITFADLFAHGAGDALQAWVAMAACSAP